MINELLTPEHPLKDETPNIEPISLLWCQQGQSKGGVFWKLKCLKYLIAKANLHLLQNACTAIQIKRICAFKHI